MYVLNKVGDSKHPWHTLLSVSTFSEHSEFSFIAVLFLLYMSPVACNSLSGMFLASRMLNSICLVHYQRLFQNLMEIIIINGQYASRLCV
jgi:hypothetical protein